MNYVCAPCMLSFKPKQNGVYLEERMKIGPESWGPYAPYKLWVADLLECPSCGAEIIAGFARHPLAEHYEPEYERLVEKLPLIGKVEDP